MAKNIVESIQNSVHIQNIKNDMSKRQNLVVEICITNECNQNCSYCFESCNRYSITNDEITRQLELIKDLCDKFDNTKYSSLELVFWGGEPMMNIDYIEKIFILTKQYSFVNYFMYTNGTLFSKFLKLVMLPYFYEIRNRFHIQISYDGEPHNTIKRGYSYASIKRTIQMLYENKLNLKFKATLTYDMIKKLPEIWKSYEHLQNEFPNININYSPTLDTTQHDINNDYYIDWINSLIQISKYELNRLKSGNNYLWSWFYSYDDKSFCGIDNRLMLNTDGNIYICHGCPYSKNNADFIINNTKNIQSLYDIFYHNKNRNNKLKRTCELCGASICNNCHITFCNSKYWKNAWIDDFDKNKLRCKFFKAFGLIKHALEFAILHK